MKPLSESQGSLLRSVLRTGLVLCTTLGLHLDATQVGAIQVFAEACLQAAVQWRKARP